MAFTQKHADENREARAYADTIAPKQDAFYSQSREQMTSQVDALLDQMQQQFPDIPRRRLRTQLFAAIRQNR